MRRTILLSAFCALAGCSTATLGAQPHDMSAADHEAMAEAAEAAEAAHAASYDPSATESETHCSPVPRGPLRPCWTSSTNPTSEHAEEAAKLHKMAADHRAAAHVLTQAESEACGGLADEDRDTSPFAHEADVVSASELRSSGGRLEGASIVVRAVPGLTKEYLEHTVACHVARNASMGFEMKEMDFCPLGVRGAEASVEATSKGFRVDVSASDDVAARGIAARALALAKTPEAERPTVSVR